MHMKWQLRDRTVRDACEACSSPTFNNNNNNNKHTIVSW